MHKERPTLAQTKTQFHAQSASVLLNTLFIRAQRLRNTNQGKLCHHLFVQGKTNVGTNKDAISCTECFSPPEHFVHQGPKAPEHEPRQIVSSSLCTNEGPTFAQTKTQFHAQSASVLLNTLFIRAQRLRNTNQGKLCHHLCVQAKTNIGTNKDAISCTECFSPPEHFVHQGPKAPEHEPRQIMSSSLCTRKDQRWHKQRRNFMHRVLQSS